jgi:hypothetical protein
MKPIDLVLNGSNNLRIVEEVDLIGLALVDEQS